MIEVISGEKNCFGRLFKLVAIVITLLMVMFIVYAFKLGIFDDKMFLVNYISKLGFIAPVIFIGLQIFQVIIPIIPGGISCLAGVLAFGPVFGFIYNYIGLIIGSIIVYYLSKKYGIILIKKIFSLDIINKYLRYVDDNCFKKIFFVAILLPWFPDDFLCYIAGISNIRFKSFLLILLICKPVSLLFYSLFMNVW